MRTINVHKIYKLRVQIIFQFKKIFLHSGHLHINSKEIF